MAGEYITATRYVVFMGAIEQKVTYEVAGKKVNLTAGKCPLQESNIHLILCYLGVINNA